MEREDGPMITAVSIAVALISGSSHPWLSAPLLAGTIILVLWTNTWEMRQRGVAYQTLMSFVSIAGVAAGYLLGMR